MNKSHEPQPDESIPSSLRHVEAWSELLRQRPQQERLAALVSQSQELAANHPDAQDWIRDTADVRRRWQHMVEAAGSIAMFDRPGQDLPSPEYLDRSIGVVEGAICTQGWRTPGLGLEILGAGFAWMRREGAELNESVVEVVDLRDMREPDPVMVMPFEQFKSLSDAEVEAVRGQVAAGLEQAYFGTENLGPSQIPGAQAAVQDSYTFREYMKRRKYGTPDREVSDDEVRAYVSDLMQSRRRQDADYGEAPQDFDELPESLQYAAGHVLGYFAGMRDATAPASVDSYSLRSTIGLEPEEINALVDTGVLQPVDSYEGPDGALYGMYVLSRPYDTFWRARNILG